MTSRLAQWAITTIVDVTANTAKLSVWSKNWVRLIEPPKRPQATI